MKISGKPGGALVKDRFTTAMFMRAWVPALMSSIGWSLSDIADAVVVGQHLGTVGLAAISLILPIYMLNCMVAHGLGIGGASRYAVYMSQGKRDAARKNALGIYLLGLIFSVATAGLGLIFLTPLIGLLGTTPADGALFESTRAYLRIQLMATPLFYFANLFNYYLRNDGQQRRAGTGSLVGNLCDIALNVVLVLIVKMGTGGAALATALGQIISIGIYLPGVLRKGGCIGFSTKGLKAERGEGKKELIAELLRRGLARMRSGLSVSIQYLYQMIFFLLCNNLLMRIGGERGIAVFDVLQNTSYLILYLYEGTARAMQPVASTYYGERNSPGLHNLIQIGFTAGIGVGSLVILICEIWPMGLCHLFGIAGSGAEALACRAIRIFGGGAFFGGLSILLCNWFQALDLHRHSLILETMRGLAVLIPATILCSLMGLENFWWLFPITEVLSLGLMVAIIQFQLKRGYTPLKTIPEEQVFRRTILSTNTDVGQTSEALEEFCDRWEATPRQKFAVMNTVEELGLAILKHGFRGRKDGYIQVTVLVDKKGQFELHMRDDATAFNPFELKGGDIRVSEDLDATGILMIRKQAKSFFYRNFQGFNNLIIIV